MLRGPQNKETQNENNNNNDNDIDHLLLQLVRKHLQTAPLPEGRWENWEPGLMALSRGILSSTLRPSPTLLPFISSSGILSPALNASIVAGRLNNEREKVATFKNLLRTLEKITTNPSLISPMMYLFLRLGDKNSITPNTPSSCSPANLEGMAASYLSKRRQMPPPSPSTQYSRQKLNGVPNPFDLPPHQNHQNHQNRHSQEQQPNIPKKLSPWTPQDSSMSHFEQFKQAKADYSLNENVMTDIIPLLRGLKKLPKSALLTGCFSNPNDSNEKSTTGQGGVFMMLEELGTLYLSLIGAVTAAPTTAGAVRMGFNRALEKETLPYLKLVAEYEARMAHLDLCQTLHLFKPQRRILSFLMLLHQDTEGLHGLPLLQRIRSYGGQDVHGDPSLARIVTRILEGMLPPLLDTLAHFISEGVLMDPEMEFPIVASLSMMSTSADTSLPYAIRKEWLHDSDLFLGGPGMTEKVLIIGLTRKFIIDHQNSVFFTGNRNRSSNNAMEDGDYNHERYMTTATTTSSSETASETETETTKFFNPQEISKLIIQNRLRSLLVKEHQEVISLFSSLVLNKLRLLDHLQSIRKYLHFGSGDFAISLVQNLQPLLDRPSATLQKHPLVTGMEDSCRDSVAKQEEVGAFLDVRLHDLSNTSAATQIQQSKILGWDVFTLDYRVPHELQSFLCTDVMEELVRVSHFLFSLRRVRLMLSMAWRRLKTCAVSLMDGGGGGSGDWLAEGVLYCKEFLLTVGQGRQMLDAIDNMAQEIVSDCWSTFFKALTSPNNNNNNKDPTAVGMDLLTLRQEILGFSSSLFQSLFLISSSPIKRSLAGLLSVILKMEYGIRAIESVVGGDGFNSGPVVGGFNNTNNINNNNNNINKNTWSNLRENQTGNLSSVRRGLGKEFSAFVLELEKEGMSVGQEGTIRKRYINDLLMALDYSSYHKRKDDFI